MHLTQSDLDRYLARTLDRDGRVISCHSPEGNGALTMADLLCDLTTLKA